jgi:hypothetical protein
MLFLSLLKGIRTFFQIFITVFFVDWRKADFNEIKIFKQCCGSETKVSDPVPDPAGSKFRIWIRIRNRIRNRIQIQILDSNPNTDQKLAKTSLFNKKF